MTEEESLVPMQRVRPGDIIGIPLAEHLVGVGIVLHLSEEFKDAMLVGYYDRAFPSFEAIDVMAVGGAFIDTPNYTGTMLVKRGFWRIVGERTDLLVTTPIPELRIVSHLFYMDTYTRWIPREEWGHYTEFTIQGGKNVENKLRRHFATH